MIKLSEHDIDDVVKMAESSWDNTIGFSANCRKEYFLRDLRHFLLAKSAGMRYDTCHRCLGSGYEPIIIEEI